jgi:hypothetical protein
MATPPEAVRTQLAVVTTAAATDLATTAAQATPERSVSTLLNALPLIVPSYYDAAGALAVAWYDERRDESRPTTVYAPNVIGDPATDWIEREVAKFQQTIEADMEGELQRILDEATRLAEKEVARGFRDSVTGNVRMDEEAVGWSRVARPGACKLCVMLADRGAVFSEATANFAAHTDCHCAARPEFRNGEHGPEASVEQYLASTKNRTAKQRKRLREYLNENYPDAPG